MITVLPAEKLGRSDLGWLQSWFHFSFADYENPARVHFGALRVINDDLGQSKPAPVLTRTATATWRSSPTWWMQA